MKTADFIREHHACHAGAKWALSTSDDMSAVWEAMIEQGKHAWLLRTATRPGVFPDSTLRRLACRFVRETPVGGGRTVWDLLTDERSRKAVEMAERYADGKATESELYAAHYAARAAYSVARIAAYSVALAAAYSADAAAYSADAAAWATAHLAARAAARAAADAAYTTACAADAHAKAAQIKMIAEIGNPFRKGKKNEN